jgi:hypothetical protein
MHRLITYFQVQLLKRGIAVRCGREATPELVKAFAPIS